MIISPTHRFIFFKTQKTAGTSVEGALRKFCGPNALLTGSRNLGARKTKEYSSQNNIDSAGWARFHQHCDPEHFYRKIAYPDDFAKFDKVTIVRNPYESVVSQWFYGQNRMIKDYEHKYMFPISEGFNRIGPDGTDYWTGWILNKNDSRDVCIEKFSQWCSQATPKGTYHYGDEFVKETGPVTNSRNELFVHPCITHYFRYENLINDYKSFLKEKNLEFSELPRYKTNNNSGVKREHYSYYYNDELIEIVKKLFPKTFETFGYTFDRRVK